jgi:hypothetical protein
MGYRFHSRQKTYSIGSYSGDKDGTFSLADGRRERDKAKDLLKDGKDPSTEKQLDKHRQAAARPFGQWADEWLAGWDHVLPFTAGTRNPAQRSEADGRRQYAFSCSKDAPLSNNTLNKRLLDRGPPSRPCLITKRSRTPRHGMAIRGAAACASR